MRKKLEFRISFGGEYFGGEYYGNKLLIWGHAIHIITLLLAAMLVWFIELLFPSFFNYPYLSGHVRMEDILRFWPLLLMSVLLGAASATNLRSSILDERILAQKWFSSFLAGFWEEIGFRYLFICLGMVALVFANWIYSTVFGFVICFTFACATIYCLSKKQFWNALGTLALVILSALLALNGNPIYWLYDYIVIPVLHVVSFGSLDTVLYARDKLFVMGAILMNGKFRDGHKYSGTAGILIAWIGGFVFLHATMVYGLLTAIALHTLCDIVFNTTRYISRKVAA